MEQYLTLTEVAELARLSEESFRWLRHKGEGPPAGRVGKRLVFRESDVRAWIESKFEAVG